MIVESNLNSLIGPLVVFLATVCYFVMECVQDSWECSVDHMTFAHLGIQGALAELVSRRQEGSYVI